MKAIRLHGRGGPDHLVYEDAPQPRPGVVHGVDLVFDTVGGDTLQRSWQVVKPGGVLLSVVSPRLSFAEAKGYGVRPAWFVVD